MGSEREGGGRAGLFTELRWLRKGSGLNLRRLSQAPNVLQALARIEQGAHEPNSDFSLTHALSLMQRELDGLGDSLESRATRNAFAITKGRNPGNLTQRRSDFAIATGRHPDTIELWENNGIEELANRLSAPSVPSNTPARPLPPSIGLGVQRIIASRTLLDIYHIHDEQRGSDDIFIAARHFNAIKYTRVQTLFRQILDRPSARIRILVTENSEALSRLRDFASSLPEDKRLRFMVRLVSNLSVGIYGWEDGAVITLYTNLLPGSESPVLVCGAVENGAPSLHSLYYEEFNELWIHARPM